MSDALRVDVVQQLEHLFEVKAADGLCESSISHKVEKFATWYELQDHVGNINSTAARLDLLGLLFKVEKMNKVRVSKVLVNFNLFVKGGECYGSVGRVVFAEDFDGKLLTCSICGKLDFGGDSSAKSTEAGVFVDC